MLTAVKKIIKDNFKIETYWPTGYSFKLIFRSLTQKRNKK